LTCRSKMVWRSQMCRPNGPPMRRWRPSISRSTICARSCHFD
jgi:hypothetical protein